MNKKIPITLLIIAFGAIASLFAEKKPAVTKAEIAQLEAQYKAAQAPLDAAEKTLFDNLREDDTITPRERRDLIKANEESQATAVAAQRARREHLATLRRTWREQNGTTYVRPRPALEIPTGATQKLQAYLTAEYNLELSRRTMMDSLSGKTAQERRNMIAAFDADNAAAISNVKALRQAAVREKQAGLPPRGPRTFTFDAASLSSDLTTKERDYYTLRGQIDAERSQLIENLRNQNPPPTAVERRDAIINYEIENTTRLQALEKLRVDMVEERRSQRPE